MGKKILITGGAGFIGSHVASELLRAGYEVRALDCLCLQVHGEDGSPPEYLDPSVELMIGNILDRSCLRKALKGIDAVFHLASKVGVGQSMYQIADYTAVNNQGTATLMEEIIEHRVERLVVASSMSIYGEGLYKDSKGVVASPKERPIQQLKRRQWEPQGNDGRMLMPIPTPETKVPSLASVYALSKFDQERMCLILGRAYNIPTIALRFFNVYGPYQALSNPYTGVLAIFASQLLNNRPPLVFEDGLQMRDFVNVLDVALACRLALEAPGAVDGVFNVGSGEHFTILAIAEKLAAVLGKTHIKPEITGRYRTGDIRHCFADISRGRDSLGYFPQVSFADGLTRLAEWLEGQIVIDRVDEAGAELSLRGLTV